MDAGDYYFAIGNGAHDALNNILSLQGKTPENTDEKNIVYSFGCGSRICGL